MLNAESAVLGACLSSPQCYWQVADLISADDFASGTNARLFSHMAALARDGSAFDAVSIGDSDPVLGSLALDLANEEGWRTANVRAYAEMVASSAVARRVKQAGQQIARLDGNDVLGEAQRLIGACAPRQLSVVRHIREYLRDSVTEMQRRVNEPDALIGVTTGLPELDEITRGWQRGDLIIIAARPSVGKTALAVQCSVAGAKAGHTVFFASLEMSGVQLADRVQAHVAHVSASGMRNPKLLDEADFGRLFNAASQIAEMPLHIDETAGLTVEAIGARARQLNAVSRLGLIVIDYLTQIVPPKAQSTADALQIVTRALKALAKELQVPIILLSQLNRQGEDHRPTMRTLRDSGAIEQDADVILFLHRPDPEDREYILLILEKQRNGEVDDFHLHADMAHMTFSVMDQPPMKSTAAKPSRGFGGYNTRVAVNE